jgi:hypothetical protein
MTLPSNWKHWTTPNILVYHRPLIYWSIFGVHTLLYSKQLLVKNTEFFILVLRGWLRGFLLIKCPLALRFGFKSCISIFLYNLTPKSTRVWCTERLCRRIHWKFENFPDSPLTRLVNSGVGIVRWWPFNLNKSCLLSGPCLYV